jgi:hypothetical protein
MKTFTFLMINYFDYICRRINNNSISGSVDLSSINVSCTYEVDFSGNNIINVSYNPNLVSSQVSIMYASL